MERLEPVRLPGGAAFGLTLPQSTFVPCDAATAASLEARVAASDAWPAWLRFDPVNRRFSGTPPAALRSLELVVTARDRFGSEAMTPLLLVFGTVALDERAALVAP